jgi:hypothetical protein
MNEKLEEEMELHNTYKLNNVGLHHTTTPKSIYSIKSTTSDLLTDVKTDQYTSNL